YARLEVDSLLATMRRADARRVSGTIVKKAEHATSLGVLDKLTSLRNGQRRIVDSPPLVEHVASSSAAEAAVRRYAKSLPEDRRALLARYRADDFARKVVGVGSVGTDDAIALLVGDSDADPLFLQVKRSEEHTSELQSLAY